MRRRSERPLAIGLLIRQRLYMVPLEGRELSHSQSVFLWLSSAVPAALARICKLDFPASQLSRGQTALAFPGMGDLPLCAEYLHAKGEFACYKVMPEGFASSSVGRLGMWYFTLLLLIKA
jgi:hypothetical protein